MLILVVNAGSSSYKMDIINTDSHAVLFELKAERVPVQPVISLNDVALTYDGVLTSEAILRFCLVTLKDRLKDQPLKGVGHRVVHGGNRYSQPVLVDETVELAIADLAVLAPLHNPSNLLGIRIAREVFGELPQVAVFDTAFHQTMPARARHYAIDKSIAERHGILRYGFHGTSHKYVAHRAADFLGEDIRQLRMISCHLGNGSSTCAIEFGRSIETSMGMTPMEGLVMGSRSGDIDPGIVTYLQQKEQWSPQQTEEFLNKQSGLAGLSGVGNDLRDILQEAEQGNEQCRLAIHVFTHRLTKYIGAYAALMGGLDVLIFTAGIGENSADIRHRTCQGLEFLGIRLDDEKNKQPFLDSSKDAALISEAHSRVRILVVKTDEEFAIAAETAKIIAEQDKVNSTPNIPIAVSARHVHLTRETLDLLYGKGYELTEYKPLSQPGQFAANETVTLVGPRNQIENVRILGPLRPVNQVEISKTDEFFLGIDAPVRDSGNVAGTPGITLAGKAGSTTIKEGVIVALRHIHMHPDDAALFGVQDKDMVSVDVDDPDRPVTFHNVLIRVSEKFKLEMHIDTDEANAAEIKTGEHGVLELSGKTVCLNKRNV